jgi:hypothetical protein
MFELQRYQRSLNKTNKYYSNLIEKAQKEKKSQDEVESLVSEMFNETGIIGEKISLLLSRNWVQKAEKLMLPYPDYGDTEYWVKTVYSQHGYFLNAKGVTKIRNLIREEKTAQRKGILDYAVLLIGLIGAITGLIAVLVSKSGK